MNWIFTLLFFIAFFLQSSLLGESVLIFGNYEKSYEKRLIIGYFMFFLICYIVYFPIMLIHQGWKIFFIALSLTLIVIDVILIVVNIVLKIKNRKTTSDEKSFSIKQFIKENWLLFVFVILMISFAIANNLSYFHLNYDDSYYIGKMVNMVDTPQFYNESYFNGTLLNTASESLERLLNSYEISYAYLATLFHIRIPFFARISMSMVNYFMVAITYKEIAKFMVKKEYAQFAMLAICSFVLPFGFIQGGLKWFCIRSFDLWQFQTAMFYGGSVVRVLSLPVLFIFSYPLIKKLKFKQILIVACLSLSLLSFSSIFITNFVFFVVAIFYVKFIYSLVVGIKEREWKKIIINIVFIIMETAILFASKYLPNLNIALFNTSEYSSALENVQGYYTGWYSHDFILKFGFIPLLVLFFIEKKEKKLYLVFTAILYIIFNLNLLPELLLYSSFNYFFVALRTCASVQFLVFILYGILFVLICEKINKMKFPVITSFGYITVLLLIFVFGNDYILKYDAVGTGIHKDGWSFSRILDVNTDMIPKLAVKVGDYLNTLDYGNYNVYAPVNVKDEGYEYESRNIALASNRIVVPDYYGFNNISDETRNYLDEYLDSNKGDIEKIKSLIEEYDMDYILVKNKTSIKELEEIGCEKVLSSDGYSLLKTEQ